MSVWSKTIPKRALAVAVSLAAGGCAFPAVDVTGVGTAGGAVPQRLASVMLCLANPNSDVLVFRRVMVTLDRAGVPLAAGSSEAAIIVPAQSSSRVPLAVLAAGPVGSVPASDVSYRVDGSVALDRAFELNIPYRHFGHLASDAATADGVPHDCAGSDVAVPL